MSSLQVEKIQSLIIPLRHNNMVLPQTTIAEVISVPEVASTGSGEIWFTGNITWRNQQVPDLVAIDEVTDDDEVIDAHVQAIGIKSFIPNLTTVETKLKTVLENI